MFNLNLQLYIMLEVCYVSTTLRIVYYSNSKIKYLAVSENAI